MRRTRAHGYDSDNGRRVNGRVDAGARRDNQDDQRLVLPPRDPVSERGLWNQQVRGCDLLHVPSELIPASIYHRSSSSGSPIVKRLKLETIPLGYILVGESK